MSAAPSANPTADGMTVAASARPASATLLEAGVAALALAGEGVLGYLFTAGRLGAVGLILLHLCIIAALWLHVRSRVSANQETAPGLLTLAATAAVGPVGALGALAWHALHRPVAHTEIALLDEWYRRIGLASEADPVTRLCDEVAIGRTLDLSAPAPASFDSIIAGGSLADRQAALGLIARQFQPEYVPALASALRSAEPVVRVQAAAVAARVRGDLKRDVRATVANLDQIATRDAASAATLKLDAAARSGLLDESDRVRAESAIARLKSMSAELPARHPDVAAPVGRARDAVEADLIASRRFKDLRVSRRIGVIAGRGRYRVRPLRTASRRRPAA